MLIFIDTETTGTIRDDLPVEDPRQPRLVSLAAVLCNSDDIHRPIHTMNVVVKPIGFHIDNHDLHGIHHEYAMSFGEPLFEVLDHFLSMCKQANIDPVNSRIIGHNVSFDCFVITKEAHFVYPPSVAEFAALRPFCTMRALASIWKCRWPSLHDAYKRLLDKDLPIKHNAMTDCLAVIDIYEKGRELGYWR